MTETDRAALEAYYDGELSGFARRRMERRLRRSSELRSELEELQHLSALVCEADASEPAPALGTWQAIAGALPAIDAQRETEPRAPAAAIPAVRNEWTAPWKWGAAVAAAASVALLVMVLDRPNTGPGSSTEAPIAAAGAVRYLDTSGRSVMVIEEVQDNLTILWMMDEA